jgi:hypothetical protein
LRTSETAAFFVGEQNMPAPKVHQAVFQVGCEAVLLAYIQGLNGAAAIAADFASIKLWVKGQRQTNPTKNNTDIPTSAVTAVVTNDVRWEKNIHEDNAGRNFEYVIPKDAFPSADHYRVEVTFTYAGAAGEKFKLIYEGPARSSNA